ncbi:MAG: SGNH/GDSL hydrolase family protein [Synergistaceae bacterium]|nr:SGNH/GDSL hydrolase family protein [Synergistaceae bacterium]
MSKRILCFGDSNTWGFMPDGQPEDGSYHLRYRFEARWTGILQGILGPDYRVIEEGLNGRTTMWDDPKAPYRNGAKYLDACVETHAPLDLIMIMLGTNDLKPRISGRACDSADGVVLLIEMIRRNPSGRGHAAPPVLIASPVAIGSHIEKSPFADEFGGRTSHEESLKTPKYLAAKAQATASGFIDAAKYARTGPDALHLDEGSHKKFAKALAQKIKKIA